MIFVRTFEVGDYSSVEQLYKDRETFGGQFDEARDTETKLKELSEQKPEAILVAEHNGEIVGTVTLFEDGRSAWLYRFAVRKEHESLATTQLFEKAKEILKEKGHTQVLVYAPEGDTDFEKRYMGLGFIKGSNYTAYWKDLE